MGNYHPHGDQSIYDALVRMAQDFSMRLAADRRAGQFRLDGRRSAGGDALHRGAAAPRRRKRCSTTSTRRRSISSRTTTTSDSEPTVLPARCPNLLVNGAGGIAVGMATNIPTAQPGGGDRCLLSPISTNPEITIDQLIEHVPGPDFPTGGIILGRNGIREAYHTGRGSIVVRGARMIEETARTARPSSSPEIPYQAEQVAPDRAHRRGGEGKADRGHLGHARREQTATACASSSS